MIGQTVILLFCILYLLLIGFVVIWIGINGSLSEHLAQADILLQIHDVKTDIPFDIVTTLIIVLIGGIVTVFGTFFGCCGIITKNRGILGIFAIVTFLCSLFFLMFGVYLFCILETMQPLVQQDVQNSCRREVYPSLIKELNCEPPKAPIFERLEQSSDNCRFLMNCHFLAYNDADTDSLVDELKLFTGSQQRDLPLQERRLDYLKDLVHEHDLRVVELPPSPKNNHTIDEWDGNLPPQNHVLHSSLSSEDSDEENMETTGKNILALAEKPVMDAIEKINPFFIKNEIQNLNSIPVIVPTGKAAPVTSGCDLVCQQRAKIMRRAKNPCKLLSYMCISVGSSKVGTGACRLTNGIIPTTTWEGIDPLGVMTRRDCKHFCAVDIECTGYSYGSAHPNKILMPWDPPTSKKCITISPNKPPISIAGSQSDSTLQWIRNDSTANESDVGIIYGPITETDGSKGLTCYYKESHRLVTNLVVHARRAATMSIFFGLFLVSTFAATWLYILKVSARRGRGDGTLFPCCIRDEGESFFEPISDTESEYLVEFAFEHDDEGVDLRRG